MILDHFQLQQCSIQAKLFENLVAKQVDARKFIPAFMHSRAADGLDADYDRMQWAGEEYILEDVMDEASLAPEENCPKYDADVLYWIGFIYRYWHFLTGESSPVIYAQANVDDMLASYGLHVEDNDMVIQDLKRLAQQKKNPDITGIIRPSFYFKNPLKI